MTRLHGLMLTAVALAFGIGMAQAMPLTAGLNAAADDLGLIEHVDACNRYCKRAQVPEWGGAVRWHRHVGKACRPVHCTP
jgi:hypothetical protein